MKTKSSSIFTHEKTGCWGSSPSSSNQAQTVQKNPVFVFDSGLRILNICEQTLVSKNICVSQRRSISKVLPASKIKDPRSVCETFRRSSVRSGISLTVSHYDVCLSGLGSVPVPYSMSKCFCQQSGLQQQMYRPQYFHAHSQMYKQYYSFRTQKSPHRLHEPWT